MKGHSERTRKYASRSQSGCLTCRGRHIKCGEEKPDCRRCVIGRHTCKYDDPKRPSISRQVHQAVQPDSVRATAKDLCQFDYFRGVVAVQTDEFSDAVYGVRVLQLAHVYPAIWFACLTEAAIHQRAVMIAKSPTQTSETALLHVVALHQHGNSLRRIIALIGQKNLSSLDKGAVAAANAMFIRTTIRCGQLANTFRYLNQGVKLINQWELWDPAASTSIIPSASLLLYHAQIDGLMVDHGPFSPWPWERTLAYMQKKPLLTSVDACLELELIWTGIRRLFKQQGGRVKSRERIRTRFEEFNTRFDGFEWSNADRWLMSTLYMRRDVMDVMFQVDLANLEISWDPFTPNFEEIITSAEVVFSQGAEARDALSSPAFISMVQYLARICRQPVLRRRIISLVVALLHWRPPSSAILLCTDATDAIQRIEEMYWHQNANCGCVGGEFVCNDHRVTEMDVRHLAGKGQADLLYRTVQDAAAGRHPRRRRIVSEP